MLESTREMLMKARQHQYDVSKKTTIELISLMQICIEAMVSPIKSKLKLFGSINKANI